MKTQSPPTTIKSKNLILKKHELIAAEEMYKCITKDRKRLEQFLPWVDLTKKLSDTEDYISLSLKLWKERSIFDYGIYLKSNESFIGNIGAHAISYDNEKCELGYWIYGEYEGKGLMSEAVVALEKEMFGLGFNRIEIRCSSVNKRSSSIPKRLGYRLDGVLRQDSIEKGVRRDTLVFSKLSNEESVHLKK